MQTTKGGAIFKVTFETGVSGGRSRLILVTDGSGMSGAVEVFKRLFSTDRPVKVEEMGYAWGEGDRHI